MFDLNENHYVVRRWNWPGGMCAHACFATAEGATAWMCNGADVAYTIACLPRALCHFCNPRAPRPTVTAWQGRAPDVMSPEAEVEEFSRREVRLGRDYGEQRGVYAKEATGHYHHCPEDLTQWGLCYRGDCGGQGAGVPCPWHEHTLAAERRAQEQAHAQEIARMGTMLDRALAAWAAEQGSERMRTLLQEALGADPSGEFGGLCW